MRVDLHKQLLAAVLTTLVPAATLAAGSPWTLRSQVPVSTAAALLEGRRSTHGPSSSAVVHPAAGSELSRESVRTPLFARSTASAPALPAVSGRHADGGTRLLVRPPAGGKAA